MSEELDELDVELPPLKVTCTSVDCEKDLHCYLKKRGMALGDIGSCRACGARPVEWERIHKCDVNDIDFTFEALMTEKIRHHMWTIPFDEKATTSAQHRGRTDLYGSIRGRLKSSIGKAQGVWDGRQTRMSENVVFYAQHATATCCRKCLNYWYGIPTNRPLSPEELDYCETLVKRYLDQRLPELQDEKIPRPRGRQVV